MTEKYLIYIIKKRSRDTRNILYPHPNYRSTLNLGDLASRTWLCDHRQLCIICCGYLFGTYTTNNIVNGFADNSSTWWVLVIVKRKTTRMKTGMKHQATKQPIHSQPGRPCIENVTLWLSSTVFYFVVDCVCNI